MKGSSGAKPDTILGKLSHFKYEEYVEMDNDSVNQKMDEFDNESSIHADIGGMYTERKLAIVNDTEVDMNPHDFSDNQQAYIQLDNRLESDPGRFSSLSHSNTSQYETQTQA